jgi:hypothetical protein
MSGVRLTKYEANGLRLAADPVGRRVKETTKFVRRLEELGLATVVPAKYRTVRYTATPAGRAWLERNKA